MNLINSIYQTYVVLYYNHNTSSQGFAVTNGENYVKNVANRPVFDYEKYVSDNPGISIQAVFKREDDVLMNNEKEKDDFSLNCDMYGFKPSDYNRIIRNDTRDVEYVFKGFLPANKKYKALLINTRTGRKIKSTLSFVRNNMTDEKIDEQ